MNVINKHPLGQLGYGFIPAGYLPEGKDEYYLRNEQGKSERAYRHLRADEIEVLVKNENTSDNWDLIYVTDRFDPELVMRCQFFGLIRLGDLEDYYLEFHDLRLPVGLYDSTIVSSDIGSNVAIQNVHYLGHYIIGNEAMLINIDEMLTSNYAKFGNGIVKAGEAESVRIWLALGNENEGRRVAPFDGMLPADAWLWAKHRDDTILMQRLLEMVNRGFDSRRGWYGTVGDRTIIKNCRIVKDTRIGSDAYIKGANKLKNLTIHSDERESSQIGEGVELVNGIIGYGSRIFYGVKAVRFIVGTNSSLKYGARLINSFLGDNSTVSCCEVLNSLIFPGHEQHHNNSFLCASMVLGQSNMAAGVNAGSNHNSRANDGEIVAGRGFWPGLCASLKHPCRFASFTLLAKGSYPAEMNIMLPFSLVSNNESRGELQVMPGYWFKYNMYALARNAWKYQARDKRAHKGQMIEFNALAPDTVEEMFVGMALLEAWVGKAACQAAGRAAGGGENETVRREGREMLMNDAGGAGAMTVFGEGLENSSRPVRILKAAGGYAAYREMIHYYGVKTLVDYMSAGNLNGLADLKASLCGPWRGEWVNLGGQLVRRESVEDLKERVRRGEISTWDALHGEYGRLWREYPREKARHALGALLDVNGIGCDALDGERWARFLDCAGVTAEKISQATYQSRAKDYTGEFRRMTFANEAEMRAVMGDLEQNDFIAQIREQTQVFLQNIEALKNK